MSETRLKTGARVAFRLEDVICPDFDQIVAQMGPDLSVSGEIVLLSDRGKELHQFAIVNVAGVHGPLIVPVGKLQTSKLMDGADIATRS